MPRVIMKMKNRAGKPYDCCKCDKKIKPGEKYYEWSFRYGGTHRQHAEHGSPKQSQLTQSKMSGAYGAIEWAEESIAKADNAADISAALESAAEEIGNVKDEYQESLDNMGENLAQGSTGQEIEEKVQELESFADTISNAASEIEGEQFDEQEPPADSTEYMDWETKRQEFIEDLKQRASDALGEFSL